MLRSCFAALALLALLVWTGPSRAADPVSSSRTVDAPTITLGLDKSDDNTELVHFFRHRFGFYRPFYGSYFYRPYYGGFYGGFGYYPSYYYRPYFGYGYGFGYGYYPRYYGGWGGYYGGFGGYGYSYSYPGFYFGCSLDGNDVTACQTTLLGAIPPIPQAPATAPQTPSQSQSPSAPPVMPRAPADSDKGEYNYDGGPDNPVPMPQGNKPNSPNRAAPLRSYLVSLPAQSASQPLSYRAYGQQTFATPAQSTRATAAQPSGFAYQGYGEANQATGFAAGR